MIKSAHKQVLRPRAYTPTQVDSIQSVQAPHNALATALAYAAGLRAHELLTLRPIAEQPIDIRPALDSKWRGREGVAYSVKGKGGLIREVRIPQELANALEQRRLQEPRRVTDRQIYYKQYYDIGGGLAWSRSFSAVSKRALGRSTGAHGLRHSYAQERLNELQRSGLSQDLALATVSQEMGHFRPEITETYLR
ncbi:MAG: site-specific integrase [bacterium]|nr:site-specific integrase [bacterium]